MRPCFKPLLALFGVICGLNAEAQTTPPVAQPRSCGDDMVEIRLVVSRNSAREFAPGRDPAALPQAVLRLPRHGIHITTDDEGTYWITKLCDQTVFTAFLVSTLEVDRMAARLGIPHADLNAWQQIVLRLDFPARPPPVDDSADRAGFAARGAWVIDQPPQPPKNDHGSANFCLVPPAPPGQCYVSSSSGMTYISGGLRVLSRAFNTASLSESGGRRRVTVTDLDRHFAFLRALVDAAVVHKPNAHP